MHNKFDVGVADYRHARFAERICDEMALSARARGTGIAKRSPDYIRKKMEEGKAIIAMSDSGEWAGFCYIETWEHGRYVANSGLIVAEAFRRSGLAKRIKQEIFSLSKSKYPDSKIFGLTTGLAVMKINSELGYEPVTYSELTSDDDFWAGCKSCVNYEILMSKERKNCLCTAMLFDPSNHYQPNETSSHFLSKGNVYERLTRLKHNSFLRKWIGRKENGVMLLLAVLK